MRRRTRNFSRNSSSRSPVAEAATIARPYAKAAFAYARDCKALGPWSDALRDAAMIVADGRVADLLTNPNVDVDHLVALFAGLGGGAIDPHWQNFVRLLAGNRRLAVLADVSTEYETLRAAFENEADVEVTSAVPLSAAQCGRLAAALRTRLKRDVRIRTAVDPQLIGGAVIRSGDLVIDGSLRGRLERMASELGG